MTIDQLSRPPRRGRAAQRWRTALVPLALLAPLGLAACGGADSAASDSAASDRATSSGDTASSADMQDLHRLPGRKNGLKSAVTTDRTVPRRRPEERRRPCPTRSAMASAQEACADLAPEGGFGSGGGAPGGGADMAEYTSCLEENGVTVPEPGQGRGQGAPPEGRLGGPGGHPARGRREPHGPGHLRPRPSRPGRRGLRIASARAPVRTGRPMPRPPPSRGA